MTLNRFIAPFLAALLIYLPVLAQAPAPPQSQKEGESQDADKELEKHALALLDEVVGEAMSLRLVQNRIYVLTTAADLCWKHNEDRARALLAEAVNQFMAIGPTELRADPQAQLRSESEGLQALQAMAMRMEMRMQLLQTLAAKDSRIALDFLRASRLPEAEKLFGGKGSSADFEREFEMQLAARIAENDPGAALRIAEESLKQGVNPQVYEIWANLLNKDPKTAAKLSGEITAAIKSADASKDYQAIYIATSMLTQLRSQMRPSNSKAKESQPSQEAQEMFRDLLDLMVTTALKVTTAQLLDVQEQGRARDLLTHVQIFLPEIEKYLPSRAQSVRAKLAQFDKAFYRQPEQSLEIFADIGNKSPDELIATAAKSQDEVRDALYSQAVMKLIEQGDTARARQVVKDFLPDNGSREALFAVIDQKETEKAIRESRLEDARKRVAQLGSNEERALALIGLAAKAEAEKDQKSQRELLKEAGELLGARVETRSQVEAQLLLAAAFLNFDRDRSFEILGSAIDRLNTILNAVATITKFDQGLGSDNPANAMGGEMLLSAGEFANVTTNLDQRLLAFARKDFDRTVTTLKRWEVNEVRLAICLTLLNRVLGDGKIDNRTSRIED
jgi:hypothetical protein